MSGCCPQPCPATPCSVPPSPSKLATLANETYILLLLIPLLRLGIGLFHIVPSTVKRIAEDRASPSNIAHHEAAQCAHWRSRHNLKCLSNSSAPHFVIYCLQYG